MKKIFKLVIPIGIFAGGVFLGKLIQRNTIKKKTKYAGTLQIYGSGDDTQLFLALDINPEELKNSANVIFKVGKPK